MTDYERKLFRLLTRRERQAVALFSDGLTSREIGSALGIAEGTVKSLLNRARERARAVDLPIDAFSRPLVRRQEPPTQHRKPARRRRDGAISDLDARRRRINLGLATLCRAAQVDYVAAHRALSSGRLDPDAVLRLEAALARMESDIYAALAASRRRV
jgi:transposase